MNRRDHRHRSSTTAQRGFTLVELMVTMVILALVGYFIYTVFIAQHDSYMTQQDVSETQQDVRVSLDMLTRDLQSAGFGVPSGQNGIITATGSTIQFQVAQSYQVSSGVTPFLASDPDLATNTITVNRLDTTPPIIVGSTINIMSMFDRTQIGAYTVQTVNGGTKQLTLNAGAPPVNAHQGDLIVGDLYTISYSLNGDVLQRTTCVSANCGPTTSTESLADHIQNIQFGYTLADGTVINPPAIPAAADLKNIRMIQVTLTSRTEHDVSKFGGTARIRSLSTDVKLKNGVDNRVS
jgi:prepilin-type N-terminal cleavage/methylation domain-containing protein